MCSEVSPGSDPLSLLSNPAVDLYIAITTFNQYTYDQDHGCLPVIHNQTVLLKTISVPKKNLAKNCVSSIASKFHVLPKHRYMSKN